MGPPRGRGPQPKPEAAAAAVTDGPGDAQPAENLENLGALISHRLVGCTPGCPSGVQPTCEGTGTAFFKRSTHMSNLRPRQSVSGSENRMPSVAVFITVKNQELHFRS